MPFAPLEFVLQVAFTTPPAFLPSGIPVNTYVDKDPWIVPESGKKLESLFQLSLARDPRAAAVMAHMRDFAVLQRLFRIGLAGKLGREFPFEKFVVLTRACATDDYVRTYRWIKGRYSWQNHLDTVESYIGEFEKITESDSLANERETAATNFKHCVQFMRENPEAPSSDVIARFNLSKLKDVGDRVEAYIANELVRVAQNRDLYTALKIESESGDFASSTVQHGSN
jgi:hypothetical protein